MSDIDDDTDDDTPGWCYEEESPYWLESLGDDAYLTGCPLCGEQCYRNPTMAQIEAKEEYFRELGS